MRRQPALSFERGTGGKNETAAANGQVGNMAHLNRFTPVSRSHRSELTSNSMTIRESSANSKKVATQVTLEWPSDG
jgi:hypothetical protein